jgi:DNA-binding transcriptional LysR family regulator
MQQMDLIELPRILARYHRRRPHIELRLRQASAAELHRQLAARELDLAITSPPEPGDDRLVAVDLFHTPIVLACRPEDPCASRNDVGTADLAGRNLVGYPRGWAVRTLAEQMLRNSQADLDFNFEINDTSTLLDLVEAGLGVTLIAEAIATQRAALRTVRLQGAQLQWIISAVTTAPAPTNPAAAELWKLLLDSAQRAGSPTGHRNPNTDV